MYVAHVIGQAINTLLLFSFWLHPHLRREFQNHDDKDFTILYVSIISDKN